MPLETSSCRCQFAVFLWIALTLWWFGLRSLESHWQLSAAQKSSEQPPLPWLVQVVGVQSLASQKLRGASAIAAAEAALQSTINEAYTRRSLVDAASRAGVPLHQPGDPLGVCIMTADFWGGATAGGTATAYHLLAQVSFPRWAYTRQPEFAKAKPPNFHYWQLQSQHVNNSRAVRAAIQVY